MELPNLPKGCGFELWIATMSPDDATIKKLRRSAETTAPLIYFIARTTGIPARYSYRIHIESQSLNRNSFYTLHRRKTKAAVNIRMEQVEDRGQWRCFICGSLPETDVEG